MIWKWIVDADEWIGELALDGAVTVILALVVTGCLRLLVSLL